MRDLRNVGGTPGGFGTFLLGLGLAVVGGYLLMQQVDVHGGYWRWGGGSGSGRAFGITLIPLLLGIGILFANGSSMIGKVLTFGGALIIIAGIVANLDINFRTTTMFNTVLILALLASGIGLIVRSASTTSRPSGPSKLTGLDDE